MKRDTTENFNKEKLIFLLASVAFSVGLYFYLISAPLALEHGPPISSQAPPPPIQGSLLESPFPEDYYVVDGRTTGFKDPRTGQLVNRKRMTPFMPGAYWTEIAATQAPGVTKLAPPPPPPPPAAPAQPVAATQVSGAKPPPDLQVKFMGTIRMNGETVALLSPKDGSLTKRVKVGETLKDLNYTVTKIEEQAIWVTDSDMHSFVLKDTDSDTGSGPSDTEDITDEGGKPASATPATPATSATPAKKDKKPKPATPAAPAPAHAAPAPNNAVAAAAAAAANMTPQQLMDAFKALKSKGHKGGQGKRHRTPGG